MIKLPAIKLYIFGDSICFGQYVSPHRTWTVGVARFVDEYLAKRRMSGLTQVAAVNGEITRQALERLEHDILSHEPDIVWLQFGLNDANFWQSERGLPRTLVGTYVSNMIEMITRIQAAGAREILVATNHRVTKIPEHLDNNHYADNVVLYNEELRAAILETSLEPVCIVDIEQEIQSLFDEPSSYLQNDGVHLNAAGHESYLAIAIKHIERALARHCL